MTGARRFLKPFIGWLANSDADDCSCFRRDEQTGLATRASLLNLLSEKLASKHQDNIVVFAASIDRFEQNRAMLGYDTMTSLVREIGEKALGLKEIDHVARIAPDSVAGYFVGSSVLANAMMSRLHRLFQEFTGIEGGAISVDTTIGFALAGQGADAETVLQQAELALGQARANWRRTWLFSQSEYGAPEKKLGVMSDLRKGLENGDFDLHYQPQIDARSGEVRSVEALLRWNTKTPSLFSIGELIELAEGTGDIRQITKWAVKRAVCDAEALSAHGFDLRVALNMSGHLICESEFISEFITLAGDQLDRLQVEITETAMLRKPDLAIENLRRLSDLGVPISMDDYGTGYSSLSQIQELPIDELKIDQRFIKNLTATNKDPLIVRSTIDLAHALEMEVVAEGVEDAATYALLKAMGCDMLQGFFISRPLPLEKLVTFLLDEEAIAAKHSGPLLNILKTVKQ